MASAKNSKASVLKAIDRLIAKLRAEDAPELNAMIRHLSAARAVAAGGSINPRAPVTPGQRIAAARAEIARLSRWPDGAKMKAARHALKLQLMLVVRSLVERGYGTPAKPLPKALARAAGMSESEASTVVLSMLKAGCLNFPRGARVPVLYEDACLA